MSERENIFSRIREALKMPAHRSGYHSEQGELPGGLPTLEERRKVLPIVPATEEGQIQMFARNAADLKAVFKVLPNASLLAAELKALAFAEGWKRVAGQRTEMVEKQISELGLPALFTEGGYDKAELEKCDVGITECDALVAQTGSVVVTSRTTGGRALSVLPPHHVVIARRDQLIPDLPAAYALLQSRYANSFPSMISFVTGPSRTGDIERILVLGAHGPKKLTIYLIES